MFTVLWLGNTDKGLDCRAYFFFSLLNDKVGLAANPELISHFTDIVSLQIC